MVILASKDFFKLAQYHWNFSFKYAFYFKK